MKVFGIIPSRFGSTRARGKLLRKILGKPLIEWVWQNVSKMSFFEGVFIATDSEEIEGTAKNFGGKIIKTSSLHKCGTDRVAEAARILDIADEDVIVNIQADEPLISSLSIENLVLSLRKARTIDMATLAYQSSNIEEFTNSNVVKVVVDNKNFALYFSRSQIPHYRNGVKKGFTPLEIKKKNYDLSNCFISKKKESPNLKRNLRSDVSSEPSLTGFKFLKHLGIYAYKMDFLQKITNLPLSQLEEKEKLEQLRVLENGYKIKIVISLFDSESVNTEEDFKKVEDTLQTRVQNS